MTDTTHFANDLHTQLESRLALGPWKEMIYTLPIALGASVCAVGVHRLSRQILTARQIGAAGLLGPAVQTLDAGVDSALRLRKRAP